MAAGGDDTIVYVHASSTLVAAGGDDTIVHGVENPHVLLLLLLLLLLFDQTYPLDLTKEKR